ncbi:MAG: hypothetical protein IKK33_06460 [Lachnospiraceae bacterium]|nr:hypothetical protein [Lachnospiraceae bacterium]
MRKKITKVLLSLMVALVCMCNCSINVFAEPDSFMTKEEVMEKYSVDTGNTQADELFNTFLEHASIMASEDYDYFIDYYEILASYYQERYVDYCNGTVEEWESKEGFEQFLWDVLYVSPKQVITDYSYDKVLASFQ